MTEINDKRVVITGGTGFLGQALAESLGQLGVPVTVVSRKPPRRCFGDWKRWDGRTVGDWAKALEGAAAVVNLAGRSVDCRKTPDNCDEILRSRVDSVLAVGEAMKRCEKPPQVWVQASTAHIYGDPIDAVCDENAPFGYGLAPFVGERWEAAFEQACPPEIRRVVLRTSFVLGNQGGAFPVLKRLAKLGLGGAFGSGKQWISWLHIDDAVSVMRRAIFEPEMQGIYNVTAPEAETNQRFMHKLRRALGVPIGLPSPSWMIRLGAATLIDTDPELALYGRRISPARLIEEGFVFKFTSLEQAFADLAGNPKTTSPASSSSTQAA